MRQLLPYEKRLLEEYNELKERMLKLRKFINNYDDFASKYEVLDTKGVLIVQYNAMADYRSILETRLYKHGIDY